MRFDPAAWSEVYDEPSPSPQQLVFRRGAELARAACLALAGRGEHWVDVGAGPGHLAEALAGAGLRVTAVDSDPLMLAAARARCGNRVEVVEGEAGDLPLPDGGVDGVVATALVGLLPDPGGFFGEVRRVLRPGGSAVLTFTHDAFLQRLSRLGGYAAPARRYTRAEVRGELERAGLVLRELRVFNLFVARRRLMLPPRRAALALERLAGPAGPLLARNLLAVAARPEA